MEKVRIQLEQMDKLKTGRVKFGKYKIEVKPYISSPELVLITDLCIRTLSIEEQKITIFAVLKTIFEMCVVGLCTNIKLDCITVKKGRNAEIALNIKANDFENFDSIGMSAWLKKNIVNYDSCWQSVFETVQLFTIQKSLNVIAQGLPSQKQLENTIKEFGKTLEELNKKDPEMLKNIVRTASENNAFARTRKEFIENKNKKKAQQKI